MAALQKALYALFGDGGIPKLEEVKSVASRIFQEVCDATPGGDDETITKADMYNYVAKRSKTGISSKSVDQLFARLDVSGDGSICKDEFAEVIQRLCITLRKDEALETKLTNEVPVNHVVPGSSRMNARSGTTAFRMQVVRRRSMRRLFEFFSEVNLDGDGSINLMEFKKHISANRPELLPMAASIFYSLDNRRNGSVSFKRLLERMYPEASRDDIKTLLHMARPKDYVPKAKPDQGIMDEIQSIFQIYDDDHSGSLDEEEFIFAMSQTGGYSEEDAFKMFHEIDADGSGECSFEEFQLWYISNERKQAKLLKEADRESDDET